MRTTCIDRVTGCSTSVSNVRRLTVFDRMRVQYVRTDPAWTATASIGVPVEPGRGHDG